MLEERGVIAGWTHGFLEYAMPVLSLALIGLAWMSRRSRSGVSQGG
jgi:ABC-type dipeptide/oligopeptide/nickel transport system permease component